MNKIALKILLALSPLAFCSGCNFLQVDEPTVGFTNPKRVSVVEKAWMSRHEYDPGTGLLQPYYRGMRYGAVRSFDQKEKSVSSKEWWLKDRKLGDLADQPLSRPQPVQLQPAPTAVAGGATTPAAGAGTVADQAGFVGSPAAGTTPTGGAPGGPADVPTFEVFGSGSGASMPVFATGEETPSLPVPAAGAGAGNPVALPTIDSPFLPPNPALPATPQPGAGAPLPGMALPGAPLPAGGGAFGVDPVPGGNAFPPAPGGAVPAAPAPGGAVPAAPAPGGDNPFGAPPPPGGADPFGAPPAPGGADPFGAPPAPGGVDPFGAPPAPAPAPGGAKPAIPDDLPF